MKRLWLLLLAWQLTFTALGIAGEQASWATVEKLRHSQTIRVSGLDQRRWTGRLARAGADSLTLDVGGTERKIDRSDVQKVEVKSRGRSALIGLGIGTGIGVGIGFGGAYGAEVIDSDMAPVIAVTAVVCGAIGAGIGALLPRWKTVYRVDPSRSPQPNAKP